MKDDKHIRRFDLIAMPYNWFFKFQSKKYSEAIRSNCAALNIPKDGSVLDVGCGTGAFAYAFAAAGYHSCGIDASRRMAAAAVRRGLRCSVADAARKTLFPDSSFDLVAAAYVAHGLRKSARKALFLEMNRLARHTVLLHDFSPSVQRFSYQSVTGFLELLERSKYREFLRFGFDELHEVFKSIEIIPIDRQSSWYICN